MELYLVGSENGNIVHTDSCHFVAGGKHRTIALGILPSMALRRGYHFCRFCSPVMRTYRSEKDRIRSFAEQHHMKIRPEANGTLSIQCENSAWKIVPGDLSAIRMYHRNTVMNRDPDAVIPGFHLQSYTHSRAMAYMEYIIPHDEFRKREQEREQTRRDMISTAFEHYRKRSGKRRSGSRRYVPKARHIIRTDTSDWNEFLHLFKTSAVENYHRVS